MHVKRSLPALAATTLLLAAACSGDGVQPVAMAPTTLTLHGSSTTAALGSLLLDSAPGQPGRPAPLDRANVDSLVVVVTSVDIMPSHPPRDGQGPLGDSLGMGGPGGPMGPGGPGGPHGPHGPFPPGPPPPDSLRPPPDSLRPPPDSAGPHGPFGPEGPLGPMGDPLAPHGLFSLDVVGNGTVDLMHLPTEDVDGIVLATGEATPGDYFRVRLVIAEGYIKLKNTVITPQGDTLLAGDSIPVIFPNGGIVADVEFTIPDGGGDVPLVFDEAQTLGRVVVTGDGRVIVTPVMRRPRH